MAEHAHTTPTPTIITRRPLASAIMAAVGVAFVRPASSEAVTIGRPEEASHELFPGAAKFHPDAELIALCAEVTIHRDRFNAEGTLDSDDCPIWAAYTVAADAISEAEPQTLAGMVAKAHAAKLEALDANGQEEAAGTMGERWAWDLVNDLIRLGGRV